MLKSYKQPSLYYKNRVVFSYRALFYILIGGRGIGKTFSTQNLVLRDFKKKGNKFVWFRLTESSAQKLLARNGADFIDSKLMEKWNIQSIETKNDVVYIDGKEAGRILSLATFYSSKGVALNKSGQVKVTTTIDKDMAKRKLKNAIKKYKTIVLDEMNRERNEKKTFDISYAFVNQLENICRLDTDRRIILMGNTLEEASDIMAGCFNFIPNKFGIYKLKNKRAIIHYIEDGEKYKAKRKESVAGILMPNESTFTNTLKSDFELLEPKVIAKPSMIIRFSNTNYYTLCGNVITKYKQPPTTTLPTIAMAPYLTGLPYFRDKATQIITMAQQRTFKFDQLLTMKLFYKDIKNLRGY